MAKRQPATAPNADGLHPFEGKEVVLSTIAITGAGDGLSKAMSVAPQEFHHGQLVTVVVQCEVSKVTMVPIKDAPSRLERKHTFSAGIATIVEPALVQEVLDKQRQLIEAAAGIQPLPFNDGPDQTGTDADGFFDPDAPAE